MKYRVTERPGKSGFYRTEQARSGELWAIRSWEIGRTAAVAEIATRATVTVTDVRDGRNVRVLATADDGL